jgi:hypothetical protein
MSLHLRPETEAAITALANASGVSVEEYVAALLEQQPSATEPAPKARRPLSARIRDIWANMPAEVRAKLPTDGASQHDHYIYGTPRRKPE